MNAFSDRRPRTRLERFILNPFVYLARRLYRLSARGARARALGCMGASTVRVVCVSDTHCRHADLPPLPEGDVLIHSGDLTNSGTYNELRSALEWLNDQPHQYKVFIAGNHDRGLSEDNDARRELLGAFSSLIYLQQSSTEITVRGRTLHLYGSPLTPQQLSSWAFQYPRHAAEQANWDAIPLQTDILITHGPPSYYLDNGFGCTALLRSLWLVRPALHVFGHIHSTRGIECLTWSDVQVAYERICAGASRYGDLLCLLRGAWLSSDSELHHDSTTMLVNAASVGGLLKQKRFPAIVVDV